MKLVISCFPFYIKSLHFSLGKREIHVFIEIDFKNENLKIILHFLQTKSTVKKMVVRIEPKQLIIGNVDSEGLKILQRASWIPFLHKFSGFNLEVTRQFA